MRIFLLLLTIIVFFPTTVFAKDQIKLIYIHGTNDNNYKKKLEFRENVNKLHPYLVKEFNKSEKVKKYLLQNGKYTISPSPLPFYWGDQSKNDLNLLADWLDITKFFSPKLAQSVRSMLAHTLHDAIWIQKYNNMKPVVDKLHKLTSIVVKKEDKYIILGHSAGSFITIEYILYKLPMIDTKLFLQKEKLSEEKLNEIEKIGYRTTCIDALIDSGIAIFKKDNTLMLEKENIVNNYANLAEIEKTSCTPLNNVAGIITFGSPIALFYSGFSDSSDLMIKSLQRCLAKNNMFFLNINFAEDPLGFPIMVEDNYTNIIKYDNSSEEIYVSNNQTDLLEQNKTNEFQTKYGFVYDKSNIRSNKFVASAHTAYWTKRKLFSKSVVKAYEEGISTFLDSIIISP